MRNIYRILIFTFICIILASFISCKKADNTDDANMTTSKTQEDSIIEPSMDDETQSINTVTSFSLEKQVDFKESVTRIRDTEGISQENTVYTKLLNDYEADRITEEVYSYYTILSAYNPDLLSSDYQGEYHYGLTIQRQIQYIVDNWDLLSSETRDVLEPYLVPIDNPKSIYNRPKESGSKDKSLLDEWVSKLYINASAADDTIFKEIYVYDSVTYTIQYPTEHAYSDQMIQYFGDRINDVKTAIQEAYPEYKSLFGVGLTKDVIVELVPFGSSEGDTWGETGIEGGHYRIRLNTKLMTDTKTTKTTFVHELFHDFQFEIGLTGSSSELDWASESTAAWSEHFIYPGYNTEHIYLSQFFSTLHKDRIGRGGDYEYVGYMFFYYLTDYSDSKVVIRDFLYAAAGSGTAVRTFFDGYYSDFSKMYSEFAKYNINSNPYRFYFDNQYLPGTPNGASVEKIELGGKETDEQEVQLDSGSLMYYFYQFKDVEDAKHIQFTFQPLSNDKYKRQAAIYADGNWRTEDWSDLTEKKYCRNSEDPLEHVDAVILYYSNADLKNTGTVDIDYCIVETDDCPDKVKITINADYLISGYGNEWHAEVKMVDYCEVVEHNLFVSYDCKYDITGEYKSQGIQYMDTYGSGHTTYMGEVDIMNGFPRILYPGALGDDATYAELVGMGFDENIPETGILITIPYLESDLNGMTTFNFPPPVGTITESVPFPFDGMTMLGGIILPEDIREGNEITFQETYDTQNYDTPIDTMFTMDFTTFNSQMEGMNIEGLEMTDLSALEGLELPDGFEMPEGMEMPVIEDPTTEVLQGFTGIMNPSSSGYTTVLTLTVQIEWPEE